MARSTTVTHDERHARAVITAVQRVDPSLPLVGLAGVTLRPFAG